MKIGLTGATGFVGRHFLRAAEQAGHEVISYSRRPTKFQRSLTAADFSDLDALVHLAGENVLGLWTKDKKRRIHDSRVEGTRHVVDHLARLESPPTIFVCASGISYYGDRGDEELNEQSTRGDGFLADVVQAWEQEAQRAAFARVVMLRLGMVLGPDGGAGKLLRRIFKLGLGGRLGSGRQWMPWIHVDDAARVIMHTLVNPLVGPINAVAPQAVTNTKFTKALASTLGRPAFFHTPQFLLKSLPGGMGAFFLDSLKVTPTALQESGFQFQFPTLAAAFHDLYT